MNSIAADSSPWSITPGRPFLNLFHRLQRALSFEAQTHDENVRWVLRGDEEGSINSAPRHEAADLKQFLYHAHKKVRILADASRPYALFTDPSVADTMVAALKAGKEIQLFVQNPSPLSDELVRKLSEAGGEFEARQLSLVGMHDSYYKVVMDRHTRLVVDPMGEATISNKPPLITRALLLFSNLKANESSPYELASPAAPAAQMGPCAKDPASVKRSNNGPK